MAVTIATAELQSFVSIVASRRTPYGFFTDRETYGSPLIPDFVVLLKDCIESLASPVLFPWDDRLQTSPPVCLSDCKEDKGVVDSLDESNPKRI